MSILGELDSFLCCLLPLLQADNLITLIPSRLNDKGNMLNEWKWKLLNWLLPQLDSSCQTMTSCHYYTPLKGSSWTFTLHKLYLLQIDIRSVSLALQLEPSCDFAMGKTGQGFLPPQTHPLSQHRPRTSSLHWQRQSHTNTHTHTQRERQRERERETYSQSDKMLKRDFSNTTVVKTWRW